MHSQKYVCEGHGIKVSWKSEMSENHQPWPLAGDEACRKMEEAAVTPTAINGQPRTGIPNVTAGASWLLQQGLGKGCL